jgi:glycosyltransferase involved in cell wall biosynthesis
MRILLIGNYVYSFQESMQRFASVLQQGLTAAGHEVCLIRPNPYFGRLRPSSTGVGKWLGYIDRFVIFPFVLVRALKWSQIVHICDHANAVYMKYLRRRPHLVTCHDMLAIRSALGEIPQNPTRWTGKKYQRMILKGLNRARRVICVSESTKADLLRISQLNCAQMGVIYNGLNYPYRPMQERERRATLKALALDGKPFLLHVGGNQWYKNRPGVLKIFSHLLRFPEVSELKLVMVGKPWSAEMRRLISERGLGGKVVEVVDASNEELRALYSGAVALVFPSLHEGFGWPILEAQACGCPVFTSNRPPMTEVGNDTAIYLDPERSEDAAWLIATRLGGLDGLRERGLQNAKHFTTEQMIRRYLAEYERLLSSGKNASMCCWVGCYAWSGCWGLVQWGA